VAFKESGLTALPLLSSLISPVVRSRVSAPTIPLSTKEETFVSQGVIGGRMTLWPLQL
jgi:hypothetical protein